MFSFSTIHEALRSSPCISPLSSTVCNLCTVVNQVWGLVYVRVWPVKVAEEPGIGTAGKGEEESIFGWSGGEGEGSGEEELRAGREALHPAEWKPNAPTDTEEHHCEQKRAKWGSIAHKVSLLVRRNSQENSRIPANQRGLDSVCSVDRSQDTPCLDLNLSESFLAAEEPQIMGWKACAGLHKYPSILWCLGPHCVLH